VTLATGAKLGSYEILAPIGAGGMGEVYRAKDPRLGRDVAIKVLPEEFFEGEERRQRFEREARLLAALNHPGIAAVYSFEEISGRHLLVMELVEGEGLDRKVASGPLPLEESLSCARQIAEALEAAHEKGIVHRDLKPANVMVTPDGRVKLLDFGLAKIFEGDAGASSAPSATRSPTLTARGTAAGMILGTAAYMSPEQARGKPVDKRTDVWAFGAVLYEMLTGKRAFEGETVSDTLAAVLMKEPDWAALPEQTPAAVRRVLRRCLQRDARGRLRDIADARLELEETGAPTSTERSPFEEKEAVPDPSRGRSDAARVERGSKRSLYLSWAIAAACAAAAGALALRARAPQPVGAAPAAFGVALPPGNILPRDEASTLDVSEDGRTIVFVAESSAGRRLFRRTLGKVEAVPIEGTARAFHPFLSPDGRWVGFFSDGKIRKVPIEGGAPVTLASVTAVRGATWRADGWIVFTTGYAGGLYRVRDGGGSPEPITTLDSSRGERTHRWPVSVGGTDWVLFTAANTKSVSDYEGARLDAVNVRTKERRTVLEGARCARFAPPDHLLVLRRAALVAYRLDPARLTVGSEAVTVLDDVGGEASSGAGFFAAGGRGVLAYVPGAALQEEKLLVSVDVQGRETLLPLEPRSYFQPRFSPDGARLAFSIGSGQAENDDVWTYDLREKRMSRFTFQPGSAIPAWSPDGKWIAFSRGRGATGVYRKRVDGTSEEERLSGEDGPNFAEGYTPDGKLLTGTKSERALSVLGVPIGGKPFKLIESSADIWGALVSPSGRYVAYVSTETGSDEVFIETYPAGRGKWQVSLGGGRFPVWSRDGRRLAYVKDEEIMAVDVDDRGAFHASEPRTLFRGPYELRTAPIRNFDLGPDGRFVFVRRRTDVAPLRQLEVIVGWEGLRPGGP
jgi:serine/threonine-protein kinase